MERTARGLCWHLTPVANEYVLACAGLQVGGFFYMHREDLKRVAPLWLQYTEDVREDPEVRFAEVCRKASWGPQAMQIPQLPTRQTRGNVAFNAHSVQPEQPDAGNLPACAHL